MKLFNSAYFTRKPKEGGGASRGNGVVLSVGSDPYGWDYTPLQTQPRTAVNCRHLAWRRYVHLVPFKWSGCGDNCAQRQLCTDPTTGRVCESPLSLLYTLFGQKPHSHHVQGSTDNKYFTNGPKTFFQTINDCIHCSED